jgi:hypothetical protein
LVKNDPTLDIPILASLAGVAGSLDRSIDQNMGDRGSLAGLLGLAVLAGIIGGLVTLYLGSFLIEVSGGWLKGKAETGQIRMALAWASVPKVFSLFPWILLIAVAGRGLFQASEQSLDELEPGELLVSLGMILIIAIANLWSLILLCQTLAEVQGFRSGWRAFLSILLAFLIVVVPVVLIALCIALVR